MTIREKLLVKIAQDPNFEGADATEKALVTEIKAEMNSKDDAPASESGEIKEAAKEMATMVTDIVKSLLEKNAATEPNREAVEKANFADTEDFDTEVRASAKKQGVKLADDAAFKTFKKAYRFAEFTRGLYNKDFGRVRALAEGVDVDGGYLVPDEFRAELIQHVMTTDAVRRYATVIPMESKYLELPKLTADVKVYWGTENRAIATTTADFGNMTLTPFRMNAIIRTSRELFDDSALSIFEILRQRFRDRVADEENRVFILGNGTTQPKGINQETFRSVSAASALTPDHLTTAYYKLPENYRGTSRWLINSRTMAFLENKKDTNGGYLYPSLQAEVKTLKGRPIMVSDYVPSASIFLGDLSYYYIGDRQQMTMDISTEEGNTWAKYQVSMRVIERIDGEVALTAAFVKVTNTNIH